MKLPLYFFPSLIVEQYDLKNHTKDRWVHLEMSNAILGLPQAGILVNKHLRPKLAPFGYFECVNAPITFTLVVDNFGVKYVHKSDVNHLIASIKTTYHLPKIGPETCIMELNSGGIMTIKLSTYPCWGTSKRNCKNMSTSDLNSHSIAHTLPNQSNTTARNNGLFTETNQNCSTSGVKTYPENCWEHFILRSCCQHDGFDGIKHHCNVPSTPNQQQDGTLRPIIGLPSNAHGCKN